MALDFSISDQAFQTLDKAGEEFALSFSTGDGFTLSMEIWGFAVAAELLVCLFIALSKTGREAYQRFISTMIFAAFVGGMIAQWGNLIAPLPLLMSDTVVKATTHQSTSDLTSSLAASFSEALQHTAGTILPSSQPVSPSGGAAAPAATPQSLWQSVSASVSGAMLGIADGLVASLLNVANVILLVLAYTITLMSIITSRILLYAGLCFGPFLLALSVFGWIRSAATNWLSFMLTNVMLQPILAMLVGLSLKVMELLNQIAATHPTSQTPQSLISLYTMMLSISIILIIKQAPSIASAWLAGMGDKLSDGIPDILQSISQKIGGGGGGGGTPPPPGGGAPPPRSPGGYGGNFKFGTPKK